MYRGCLASNQPLLCFSAEHSRDASVAGMSISIVKHLSCQPLSSRLQVRCCFLRIPWEVTSDIISNVEPLIEETGPCQYSQFLNFIQHVSDEDAARLGHLELNNEYWRLAGKTKNKTV